MIKKITLSLIGILLFFDFAFAQATLTGKVNDEKKTPLYAASVALLKADSTLLKSTLSGEDGAYSFNNISQGKYIIAVSMVGYKKQQLNVIVDEIQKQATTIHLLPTAKQLNEVVVTASRPFLEQRPDKLVVNIAGSATAAGSTALEVLQKVPGVLVSEDKVSMVGKGTPMIMVDGRPSQYTDVNQVLRDLSASNIDKIEVIANPGAKYDAAGGAVINIILNRNANLGTNGTLSFASGMGIYDETKDKVDRNFYRLNPSITINHREGKINAFGSYSFFHRTRYEYMELNRLVGPNRFSQATYTPGDVNSHNFRLGLDFFSDKKNTFGFLFKGFVRGGEEEVVNNTRQFQTTSDNLLSNFQTLNNTENDRSNFSGNINWKHTFDTLGTDLNIDLDYSKFQVDNSSNIVTRLSDGTQSVNSQLIDNPVQFGVLKVDYAHPFGKNTQFETGIKASMATIDNLLAFKRNGITDNQRSTDFKYTENINAAYVSLEQKLSKWTFKAGLRTEQTIATGKNHGQKVLNRNYTQLFPSLFITRTINKNLAAVAQYSRRVNRPSYQQQNPFIQFLDSLTYTQGNPLLKPEAADNYKLSLTYQNQPFFALSYNRTHDVIFENAPRQEGNLTYTTSENLAAYDNFAAELNFPIKLGKKISGFGGNQMIYNRYRAQYLGGTFDRSKWNWLAYWQVAYKPEATWNIELSGYYMTRFLNEFMLVSNRGSLNVAIQKSFLDKKARISLNCNDILFSDKTRAVIQYQAIDVKFNQWNETRNIRLSFSYSFGNQKLKTTRERKTASESEENRVKTN